MTLLAGLEDSARVLRFVPTGRRVEGRPIEETVTGSYFPCRVHVRSTGEEASAASGSRRVVTRARMTCGPGSDVLPSDRLEVRVGREEYVYEVVSGPEPLRVTSRGVVGLTFDLVRVG
jgi:hypothetical protein